MLTIRLFGVPAIERDGRPVRAPRGRKAWALLAYLLLAERPPARRRLAELLFADADDPLGALRWTLAELRRALGSEVRIDGDPVVVRLADDVSVDVGLLTGDHADAAALLDVRGELLDGLSLSSCAEFESCCSLPGTGPRPRSRPGCGRRRGPTAGGRPDQAIAYASGAVARNPTRGQPRSCCSGAGDNGDRTAALRQVAACEDILLRDLA